MANSKNSPYEYYLDLLGDLVTGVALPSLWFCTFHLDTVNCLKKNLQTQLNGYESTLGDSGWNISNNTIKYLTDSKLQYSSDSLMGCVFAKQVDIPVTSVEAGNVGLEYGGYLPPVTVSKRTSYTPLTVTFLETNGSFLDLVIRPWLTLVAYNGFVARSKNSPKSVKCKQCDICMLSKTGPYSPLAIRKIHRFYNIAPTTLSGESYNHNADALITTQASFAYDGYTVLG